MSGFGHGPFGHFPFGHTNYGKEVIIDPFPSDYLKGDEARGAPLMKYLLTVANTVSLRKQEADQLDTMIDVDKVRSDVLPFLGSTLDVEIDNFEPTEFQRSLVGNAFLTYQFKATATGYKVRGKISGYDVVIVNFWQIPTPFAHAISGVDPNQLHLFQFPQGSGDVSGIWFTDLPPGSVSGASGIPLVPGDARGETCDYCLTAYIKVKFILVKVPPASANTNFLDRVVEKLLEVTPIHVRRLFVDVEIHVEADETPDIRLIIGEVATGIIASEFYRYDISPADMVATDKAGYVTGFASG